MGGTAMTVLVRPLRFLSLDFPCLAVPAILTTLRSLTVPDVEGVRGTV